MSTLTANLTAIDVFRQQYDLLRAGGHGHAEARRQATNAAVESVKQRLYDLQTVELDPEAEPAVARAITELRDYQYHL